MVEDKKCPKCKRIMVQRTGIGTDNVTSSLANEWICPNCGHEEKESFFDSQLKENGYL